MSGGLLALWFPSFRVVVSAASAGGPAAPLALVGEGGRVGEVAPSARRAGVVAGMTIGEALLRCPRLQLLPVDEEGCRAAWERVLGALEGVGIALEAPRQGLCYLPIDPHLPLYRSPAGVIEAAARAAASALPLPPRLGLGSSRFYAHLAARLGRGRRLLFLSPQTKGVEGVGVGALRIDPWNGALVEELEELGIATLGEVRGLGKAALGERFGRRGELLADLLAGREAPFAPRRPEAVCEERLEVEGSLTSEGLRQALAVLVERLLARPELRGRTISLLSLAAGLAGGGSWRRAVVFRQPTASRRALLERCAAKLGELPAPPLWLAVRVERVGPPVGRQLPLGAREREEGRLAETIAHLQRTVGREALGRVVSVEEEARVLERRFLLAPPEVRG